MKTSALLAALLITGVACAAQADTYDCFPACADPSAMAAPLSLCENRVVREAVRIDVETRPIREVVGTVTDPTGFVLKQVNDHVVHIPKWVGFAIDPKGALRAEAMKRIRDEAKRATGLEHDCQSAV